MRRDVRKNLEETEIVKTKRRWDMGERRSTDKMGI